MVISFHERALLRECKILSNITRYLPMISHKQRTVAVEFSFLVVLMICSTLCSKKFDFSMVFQQSNFYQEKF